ncbi:MAG: hypothetical protein OK456_07755 [Thaumarchaeota archaeon]|nr:hypothetical protein [Nitrososphaerota archaeon]
MRLRARVVFECAGAREARSLAATLHADNRTIPKGQSLRVERDSRRLTFVIESPGPACIASALSLLSDASLFQQVWTLAS